MCVCVYRAGTTSSLPLSLINSDQWIADSTNCWDRDRRHIGARQDGSCRQVEEAPEGRDRNVTRSGLSQTAGKLKWWVNIHIFCFCCLFKQWLALCCCGFRKKSPCCCMWTSGWLLFSGRTSQCLHLVVLCGCVCVCSHPIYYLFRRLMSLCCGVKTSFDSI